MFDNIINAAKGFFPDRAISYAVAGFIISALYQLVGGGGFDVMNMVTLAVAAVAAGLFASLVMGAAE